MKRTGLYPEISLEVCVQFNPELRISTHKPPQGVVCVSPWSTVIELNYVVQTAINRFHSSCVQLEVPIVDCQLKT